MVARSDPGLGDPNLAALDPIFWLHHANIDRLWEVWRRRDTSHTNLRSPYWLSGVPFRFNSVNGTVVSMVTSDVLDMAAPALDYTYEDLTDPSPFQVQRQPWPEPHRHPLHDRSTISSAQPTRASTLAAIPSMPSSRRQ